MCCNFYNAEPAAKHIHEEQSPAKVLYDLNQCCGSKYMVFGSGSWNLTQFASRSKPFHTVKITSHFEKNVKKLYLEFIIWKASFKELFENREILSVSTIFNCVDSISEYGSRFVLGKRIQFEFWSVLNLQVLIKRIYNIQCLQGRWNSLVCSTVIINFRKAWIRIWTEKNMLDSDPHHCSSRNIFRKDSYPLHIMSLLHSVAEPEPVEPKLFGDLEPEPKINLNKYFLQSVWRMLRRRKANFYLYYYSTTVVEQF